MNIDIAQTLQRLVATPSVNPMGQPVDGPEYYEQRVGDLLEQILQELGLHAVRHTVAPRRDNVYAWIPGARAPEQGGRTLLWEVHQDTVPVAGMTIDPFGGAIENGRLYGRGACDVKGGMTALLAAAARLLDERPPEMPNLILAFTVNEEFGFSGAQALVENWTAPGVSHEFPWRKPDACIVTEPTLLDVVVAHKGVTRWRMHTRGKAAHSSQPERGVNAIYRAARVLLALEEYQTEVVGQLADHPLCGRPTLSVGTIRGGVGVNLVPEECVLEIDRRLTPGEDPDKARRLVLGWLEGHPDVPFDVQHDEPFVQSCGLSDAENQALAAALADSAKPHGGGRLIGVPYGTDASVISAAGVPTVVFGPGSIEQAHTEDEWIELEQIERAVEVLVEFARDGQTRLEK